MSKKKRTIIRFILRTVIAIIKAAISLIPALTLGKHLIIYAERERGYSGAYGGEWLLIIGLFCLEYVIFTRSFELWLKAPSKRGERNGKVQAMPPSVENSGMRRGRIRKNLFQKGFQKIFSFKRKNIPNKHFKTDRRKLGGARNTAVIR